jgi:CRP-like cAMP-binding protein
VFAGHKLAFSKKQSSMWLMALNEQELSYAYQGLLKAFPEDLHIARPMIQMLQDRGDNEAARELAMDMARRMLALGYSTYALAFITICEQLKHPDIDEMESIKTMAELTVTTAQHDEDVRMFELIETLSDGEAKDFLKQGVLLSVPKGESIIKQGEISRKFYLILDGSMCVYITTKDGQEIALKELKKGEFFGEFACVYHLPRTATVTVKSDVKVLEFDEEAIVRLMDTSPEAGDSLMAIVQRRMITSVSHAHPIFSDIEDDDRTWMIEESELVEYQAGDSLLDEPSEYFYIIAFGQAQAIRVLDNQKLGVEMGVNALYGNTRQILSMPEGTHVLASKRCLVCKTPLEIFDSFSKAYGGFEYWVEKHITERNQQLTDA